MQGVNVVIVNDADFPVDITYIDLHNGDNEEERIVYRRYGTTTIYHLP